MTPQEIGTRLTGITNLLVHKISAQPAIEPKMSVDTVGRPFVQIYDNHVENLGTGRGDTFEEALDAAMAIVEGLPSPEDAITTEYMRKVSAAIDYGHEHSLDDKYVAPLRGVTKAMTDNLLTKGATS